MTSTRREVLRTGWKVGGAVLAAAAAWTLFESLRPLSSGSKGAVLELGDPANYPTDTATFVTEGRLFVANAGGHLFALSPTMPPPRLPRSVLRLLGTLRVSVPWVEVRSRR